MNYKVLVFLLTFLLLLSPVLISDVKSEVEDEKSYFIHLPSPLSINKSLEHVIQKRTCVRSFSDKQVNLSELSTILWAAYGFRDDDKRTVPSINGSLAVKIYVLREDRVYWYNPDSHSLVFHQKGDFRGKGQYWAPTVLGFVWDRDLNKDENIVGAQIGEICQNIILACHSFGLATVPTNDFINPLLNLDISINEEPKLVMPIGHPKNPLQWVYRPWFWSFLPKIRDSNVKLDDAINGFNLTENFNETDLTRDNISQLLWACYGYSYYVELRSQDGFFGQRHRTVPSGHGYYPLDIFLVTSSGVYRYVHGITHVDTLGVPIVSFLWKIRFGDHRGEIAEFSESFVEDAPVSIVSVLNVKHTEKRGLRGDDFSAPQYRWTWYYEAGSCAMNSLLTAEAWGFSGNIVEISNKEKARSILRLNDNFVPMFVMPFGGEK